MDVPEKLLQFRFHFIFLTLVSILVALIVTYSSSIVTVFSYFWPPFVSIGLFFAAVIVFGWISQPEDDCPREKTGAEVINFVALAMSDVGEISCYHVRASAAGAIAELLEFDYLPPKWVPLMQVLVSMINTEDENESTILFQLLTTAVEAGDEKVACHIPAIISTIAIAVSKHIPPAPEP